MKNKYQHPAWPPEKVNYLEEAWGEISIPAIAKKLGKTVNAVKLKAYKIGLRRHIHSGDYITLNQLFNAIGMNYNSYTIDYWLRQDFPLKHKKSINMSYKVVYIKEFWHWLERNKMLIDLSRLERNILGLEPSWVAEKRKADMLAKKFRRRPWTPREDALLKTMVKAYRYTYRDISLRLCRAESAIKRRFLDLKLKERPLIEAKFNPWTPKQEEMLEDLYYKGYIPEVMAEYIPKSASAIRAKMERMIKEGLLNKNRYRQMEEKDAKYKFVSAGISYKKALPEENWPRMEHFLASFCRHARIAEKTKEELDVSLFLSEYMKLYSKKDIRDVAMV